MIKPYRNKIVFSGIPKSETVNLCNDKIKNFISGYSFEKNKEYEIQCGENKIFLNEKEDIIELIDNVKIIRNSDTFHQNDDEIRKCLYNILFPICKNNKKKYENVLLIGGECYIYGTLINSKNIYSFSDSENIIEDCKRNKNIYDGNIYSKVVAYSNINIPDVKFDFCILNVSKKGLKQHLSSLVSSFNFPTYYISCNKQSFLKDNLSYKNEWNFNNSFYSISLYLL